MSEKIPLVSVIIPMYNAEKFIAQTLESLLCQTMKDFEVVVVNDCSTDNSVEVVESLAKNFGGRLKLVKLPKNTGTPEVPRNLAINLSRGKYLAFLDADDLFTPTALEEMTTLAEEFKADVINTTEFFCFNEAQLQSRKTEELVKMNHRVITCRNTGASRLTEPTLIPDDYTERIKIWLNNDINWATWATFCNRDFWVTNQISFPIMPVSGDILANFYCVCLAKKFLHVPNITYIYREHNTSLSHESSDAEKYFRKWLNNLTGGFREFVKFMNKIPFFTEQQDYRYAVLNWFFERVLMDARQLSAAYGQIHPAALNQLVEKEFSGDSATFSAYLFNTVNLQRIQIAQLQEELAKFYRQ